MPFDVENARKSGYSDTEIAQYLSGKNGFDYKGASASGYNPSEIINHLISKDSVTKPSVYQNVYDAFTMETGRPESADTVKTVSDMQAYGQAVNPTISTVPPKPTTKAITERNLPVMPPPMPNLAKSVMMGVNSSASDFYHLLSNLPGIHDVTKADLIKLANYYQPTPAEMADQTTILQKVAMGIGGAPNAVATYLPATEILGPIAGMAVIDALRNVDKGAWETLKGGVKGATMGLGLRVAGSMPTVPRQMAAGGALFAGQTALEGGDIKDIASSGITGAALMAGGHGKQTDVNIADQLPRSAWPASKTGGTEVPNAPVREAGRMIDVPPDPVRAVPEPPKPSFNTVLDKMQEKKTFEHEKITSSEKINAITLEEAGKLIAKGDPEVIHHIQEGVTAKGQAALQDAIKSEEGKVISQAHKGQERDDVIAKIQQIEPEINKALTGEVPKPPAPLPATKPTVEPIKTGKVFNPETDSLIDMIRKEGGISIKKEMLKGELRDRFNIKEGYNLLNNKTGKTLDQWTERAIEEKFLPEKSSVSDLLDLIRQDVDAKKQNGVGRVWSLRRQEFPDEARNLQARRLREERRTSEAPAFVFDKGDSFKINGEKFKVTDVKEDGSLTLKDGETIKVGGDEMLKYDRGTLKKGEVAPAPAPPEVYTGEHMTEAGLQNVMRGKGFDAAMPTTGIKAEYPDLSKMPLFAGEQKPETEVQQGMFGKAETPPAPDKITEMNAGFPVKDTIRKISDATAPITNDLHSLFSPATKTELSQQAAGIIRERNAKLAQNKEQLYQQLGEFRKQFNNMPQEDQIKYINDYETGQAKDKFGQFAQQELAKWWKQIQDIKGIDRFIEDYWPHFWEKGDASIWQKVFGKRPLQGPATFLRKRTVLTIQDGIDAGLKPVTTNPVDMAFLKIGEMQRFVMGHDIWQEYKDKGLVQFVRYNQKWPVGWNQINDKIATVSGGTKVPVKIVLDEFAKGTKYNLWKAEFSKRIFEDADMKKEINNLEAHKGRPYKSYSEIVIRKFISDPESFKAKAPKIYDLLKEVSDGKPELEMLWDIPVFNDETMKLPVGGRIKKGEYFAPEPVARILNNFLSPGLRGNALYDSARYIGNTLNQVQLGMSAYHLTFTSLDSVISKYSLGAQELGRGQFGKAAQHISPHNLITAPFTNYLKGSKVLNEYFSKNPSGTEMSDIVDAGIKGGFRVKMDNFYKNSSVESFWNAIHQRKYGTVASKTIPAALEYMAKPLMEHIVPRMKAGVFADMAKSQMDLWKKQGHIPTTEEQRAVYGKLWDSVDNRMGQLVYDNLFWNKTLKDVGMLTTRSLGWNLGSIRELAGGIKDVKDIKINKQGITLSSRTAYLLALPAITAIYGGTIYYLYNGKAPDDLKDYYFPKTGRTLPDGREERITLPTYMKDIFAYKEHPLLSIGHKVHPMISATIDMINNKDFYSTEIRNPEDPLVKQVQQEFEYMVKQFVPFSVRNTQQRLKAGGGIPEGIESFFGLIPAPGYVTRSPAEKVMYDYMSKHMPQVITQEEAKQKQLKYDLSREMRQGNLTPERQQQAIELGKRKYMSMINRMKLNSFQNHFKSLDIDTAIKTWKVTTPEERQSVQGIYENKKNRALADNPAMKASILQKIQEAK